MKPLKVDMAAADQMLSDIINFFLSETELEINISLTKDGWGYIFDNTYFYCGSVRSVMEMIEKNFGIKFPKEYLDELGDIYVNIDNLENILSKIFAINSESEFMVVFNGKKNKKEKSPDMAFVAIS